MERMKSEAQTIYFIQEKANELQGKAGQLASGILGSIPGGIYSPHDIPSHDFRCIILDNTKTQPHFFNNTKFIDERNLKNVHNKGFNQTKDLESHYIKTTGEGGSATGFNYADIPLIYRPLTANTSEYLPEYDFHRILVDNKKTQPHFFKNTNELKYENRFDRQVNQQKVLKSDFIKTNRAKEEGTTARLNYPDISPIYRPLISSTNGGLHGYDCIISCATVDFYSTSKDSEDIPIRIVDYRKTQPHFFQGASTFDSQQNMEPPEQLIYSRELDSTDGSGDVDIPDIPRRWAVFTHTNIEPTRTGDQNPGFSSPDISYVHIDNTKYQPNFYSNTKPIIPSSSNAGKEHLSWYRQNDSQLHSQLPDQSHFISTKRKEDAFKFESRESSTKQSFNHQKLRQEGYDITDYGSNRYTFDKKNNYPVLSEQPNLNIWSTEIGNKHFSHSDNSLQKGQQFLQIEKENAPDKSERIPTIYSDYLHNVRFNLESPALEEQELFIKRKRSGFIPDIPLRRIDMTMSQPQFYFPDLSKLSVHHKQKLPEQEINFEGSRLVSGESNDQINIPDIPRVYIRPEYRQPWFFRPAFIEAS